MNEETIIRTTCYAALENGDIATAARMIQQHDIPTEEWDDVGRTPLIVAVQAGCIPAVKLLLRHGAEVNACGRGGCTPLHVAAFQGNTEMLLLLLEAGADLSVQDAAGNTPLHWAAAVGQESAAALLMYRGADLCAENDEGRNVPETAFRFGNPLPFLRACRRMRVSLRSFFVTPDFTEWAVCRVGDNEHPLLKALGCPVEEVAAAPLNTTAAQEALTVPQEYRGNPRGTRVLQAVQQENAALLRLLLANGYNPDAAGGGNIPPLMAALLIYRYELVRLLLEYGADPACSAPRDAWEHTHTVAPRWERIPREKLRALHVLTRIFFHAQEADTPYTRDALSLAVLFCEPLLAEQMLLCHAALNAELPPAEEVRMRRRLVCDCFLPERPAELFRTPEAARLFRRWQFAAMAEVLM